MPRCYKCCKHYSSLGFCQKYNERVIISKNLMHYGLPMHPFDCLTLYYNHEREDIRPLIKVAVEHLTDKTSKSICKWYNEKESITFKQRKYLLYHIFNCYEEKEVVHSDFTFCQVE